MQEQKVLGLGFQYGTSNAIPAIRANIQNGNIRTRETVLVESERLDVIAGREYQDGTLFWVIAAASGIGYCLQVPAGTKLLIPILDDVVRYTG